MKIAVFHNQPSGGARRALHGFCRELSKRHSVNVFTLSTSDRDLLDEPAAVRDFRPRSPIRFGLYLNDLRRRLDLRDLERLNASVAREIDSSGCDVVLVDVCRFTGAPFVLRYLRTPAAYYCHEPPRALHEDAWHPYTTTYQRLRQLWRAPLEHKFARRLAAQDRSLVRSASGVYTNSSYTRSRIKAIDDVEAVVCSPGVELAEHRETRTGGGGHVLSVGALEPHKAFDFLIDSLSRVRSDARPALRLVSNDQNPGYRRSLEQKARAAGVDLSIRLRVSDLELAGEYRNAALFVFSARDEPLGLAPLEAMAHGLAVLAVGEGGLHETVQDGQTGVLVPRDTAAFARALEELLASPERRRQLGAQARAHVEEHWNWPKRAAFLEAQLASLAARRHEGVGAAVRER